MKSTSGRVVSPENVLDTHAVFEASPNKPPLNQHAPYASAYYGEPEQRVTIWNRVEQRKLSGNSAPFRKNLGEYIRKHPEWELYAGQDKEGYVPGANLIPPQRASSSRQSPVAVPRERESRRVAVQQQRERERQHRREAHTAEAEAHRSPVARSSPRGSVQASTPQSSMPAKEEPVEKYETAKSSRATICYRHAVGRESEAPLRLQDTSMPTVIPSMEEVAAMRAKEMSARLQKMGGETEAAPKKEEPASEEKKQLWEQQWKVAEAKVLEASTQRDAARASLNAEREQKRKVEYEAMQMPAVEASKARIERFKRRKATQ